MKSLEEMKFDIALQNHLMYNFIPSIGFMFDMCKDAINKVNNGEGDAEVAPPEGLEYIGKKPLTAQTIVSEYSLEFFLSEDIFDEEEYHDYEGGYVEHDQ